VSGSAIAAGHFADLAHGIRLHYASCGDPGAGLVLCVHGFPEYWAAWEDVLPWFGEWAYAVAPDLRGYNLSSCPTAVEAYRAREIVSDLVELIRALGRTRACVVAHDWGGAAAWQLAMTYPDTVERLVILNSPHPVAFARELARNPEQQAASAYMNLLRSPGAEAQLQRDDFAFLFRFFAGGAGGEGRWLDARRRQRYREVWSRGLEGPLNYYRATPLFPPTADEPGAGSLNLEPERFRVHVPTQVLWGMRDRALLPCLLDGLGELVTDLTIERLPDASHWLAHEAPAEVATLVRSFLKR